jgi:uncharacterized protein YukE
VLVVMVPPDNYDAYTIGSAPGQMYDTATSVSASADSIAGYLGNIVSALSGLRLSWTGPSASAAQEFNDRWTAATTALYGTQGDPGSGAVNQLTDGLAMAAQNYLNNEDQVAGMFSQFASAGSGGPAGVQDKVTGSVYHLTSVDETF